MRQYQRRAVAKLRTAYNSKSPLRWFDCKVLTRGYFTAYAEASPRERKLANRRMYKAIGRTFADIGTTMKQAANAIARAFGVPQSTVIAPPKLQMPTHSLYEPMLLTPKLPNILVKGVGDE